MMNLLPLTTVRGPKKKLRGKRRRFRALRRMAEGFVFDTERLTWWDMWHHHVDWDGYGNTSVSLHAEFVSALLAMFVRAGRQLSEARSDFQIFLSLDADDASNDALYVHSPSPNAENFPYYPEQTAWDDAYLESRLSRLAPGVELRVGRMRWIEGNRKRQHILVYSPRFGVSLEGVATTI